jgi:hypothetical protein
MENGGAFGGFEGLRGTEQPMGEEVTRLVRAPDPGCAGTCRARHAPAMARSPLMMLARAPLLPRWAQKENTASFSLTASTVKDPRPNSASAIATFPGVVPVVPVLSAASTSVV